MPRPKTFFEQVPLEVVKRIVGVDVRVNHGVAKRSEVCKLKKLNARPRATSVRSGRSGKP
jgi:hypothetical protein